MDLLIRDATVEDAPVMAAINLASWEATYRGIVNDAFLDRATLAERATGWRTRIATDRSPILVAEDVGASSGPGVVGYCAMSLPARDDDADEDTAEISAIYVAPTSVRAGTGSALMTAALELLDRRGFSELTLWVLTENTRAQAFYAHHDLTADGAVKWLDDLGAEELRLRRYV